MVETSFSFLSIVKVLALFRAKEANLRHRKVFYWQKFGGKTNPSESIVSEVSQYLPSRREWARPNKKQRHLQYRPSVDILHDSIYRKVEGVYRADRLQEFEWGRRLLDFVDRVQQRVSGNDFSFKRPEIMMRKKAVAIGCRPKYRCITAYRDLEDRVILALANKYLSAKLDCQLSDDCYAFRKGKKSPVGRAIGKLVDFRSRNNTSLLYVVECDIVKFFDTISHDKVKAIFAEACKTANVDDKAIDIIKAFLASYDVRDIMRCGFWQKLSKSDDWSFLQDLPEGGRFGIPQGGALSGLLSNLVLSSVDKAVEKFRSQDFLYIRYCDDIIIVGKRKDDCLKAFDLCADGLKRLGLRIYSPDQNVQYGADYYTAKSKGPFVWGAPFVVSNAIPWVSYLGYSIRYDGSARLRKETLVGHVKSIREECETFLANSSRFGFRNPADKQKVIQSFLCRLLSKGTGRIHSEPIKGLGRCWLSAFRFVGESKVGLKQMKYLDYVRSSAIARLLRLLKVKLNSGKEGDSDTSLYLGKPFSFYGSCLKMKRKSISETHGIIVSDLKEYSKPDRPDWDGFGLYDEEIDTSGWERASGR